MSFYDPFIALAAPESVDLFPRTCEASKSALNLFKVTHPHNVWVI